MVEVYEGPRQDTISPLPRRHDRTRSFQRAFLLFVVAYLASLAWFCSVKVMAFDELLSFYTARAPSIARLVQLQQTTPVSLDPPLMHLAGHLGIYLGMNAVFAVRLPSLLGTMLMLPCAFIFTRRLAGEVAASFAIVGLLIVDQFHMVEARPYGLLLGLSAVALVLWQNILRGHHRALSLGGFFFTLGVATNLHYFGILLVVPFFVAECVRTVRRRTLDVGLVAVLAGSALFVLGWLPFLSGAHQYKSHYYIKLQWNDLTRAYTSSLGNFFHVHGGPGELLLFATALAPIAFGAWLGYRHSRRTGVPDPLTEWAGVGALALLPTAGVLLAAVASGAFEIRYVIEFTLGTLICLAAGLVAVVRHRAHQRFLLVIGCAVAVIVLVRSVRQDAGNRRELERSASLVLSAPTLVTDKEEFLWLHAYHGTEAGSENAIWVADLEREIAFTKSDNIDRTMTNLRTMSGLPVISYADALAGSPTRRLIVDERTNPANWLPSALASSGAELTPIATRGPLHLYVVRLTALGR